VFVLLSATVFISACYSNNTTSEENLAGQAMKTPIENKNKPVYKKPVVYKMFAWTEDDDLMLEFFDKENNAIGHEFSVVNANVKKVSASVCPDGSSLIGWLQLKSNKIYNGGIFTPRMQVYNKFGENIGDPLELSEVDAQEILTDCSLSNKVVAWLESPRLVIQFFDRYGNPYSQKHDVDGAVSKPSLSVCEDGYTSVSWIQLGSGLPYAQFYNASGDFIWQEFALNGVPAEEILSGCVK
jgi:hypothetical protein